MPSLVIRLVALKPATLAETSLPVRMSISNASSETQQIPDGKGFSRLAWRISDADGQTVAQLSQLRLLEALSGDALPPREALRPLAAGDGTFLEFDLANIMLTPIPAGRYQLRAELPVPGGMAVSEPAEIELLAPHVEACVRAASHSSEKLACVFSHRDTDGRVGVYQRESRLGRPDIGQAFLRGSLPQGVDCGGVALALDSQGPQRWRWLVWLEGSVLRGGIGWEKGFVFDMPPVDTGLQAPRLLPYGWQREDPWAGFLLVDGDSLLQVDLPGREPAVLRRCALPAGAADLQASYNPADGGISLVWSDGEGLCGLELRDGQTGPERRWLRREGRLLAFVLPALCGPDTSVTALYARTGGEQQLEVLRMPLAGGDPREIFPLDWPELAGDRLPDTTSWRLLPGDERAPVLAQANGALLLADAAAGTSWRVLAEGEPALIEPGLCEVYGGLWLHAFEPLRGALYKKVP